MINLFKFIIGAVIGSFVTLSSIRVDRKESIVFPPSHCDHCNHHLHAWELIPVISFLFLRGKCSRCHQSIGFITFIGETTGGLIGLFNPLSPTGGYEMVFDLLLLYIAECDYRDYLIPTWSILTLAVITSSLALFTHTVTLPFLLLSFVTYLFVIVLNDRFKPMGNGDVDLIFIIFIKAGFRPTVLIILISALLAIVKYLIHHRNIYIPYVPYLSLGYALITFL